MPLNAQALLSLDEVKTHLNMPGSGQDKLLEQCINRATDLIEAFLDRQLVTRGDLTEYHSMTVEGAPIFTEKLWTLQFPIIAVTSVNEDIFWPRTYGASSLLVAGTDYEVVSTKGMLRRLTSTGYWRWAIGSPNGSRVIRVIYSAGYQKTDGTPSQAAPVPDRIKNVALRLVANMYQETNKGMWGVQSQSDSTGNFTRYGPATLSKDMEGDLYTEGRHSFSTTGEAA